MISRSSRRPTGRRSSHAAPAGGPRHSGRRARRPQRNRRRGAPRSLVVRRALAVLLAGCAALLILRPSVAASPAPADAAVQQGPPAGIPLVLPLADPAFASVLTPGEQVDLYVAHGDQPPVLTLSGVHLLDIHGSDPGITSTTSHSSNGTYIVVQITASMVGVVETLLAATHIVATVSAVDPN